MEACIGENDVDRHVSNLWVSEVHIIGSCNDVDKHASNLWVSEVHVFVMMWSGTSPISGSMKCMSMGIVMTGKTRQMGSSDTDIQARLELCSAFTLI